MKRKVLVTGASSEISQAIARRRAAMGDSVVLTSRTASASSASQSIIFDLTDPASTIANLDPVLKDGLSALVLCAATPSTALRRFHKIKESQWAEFLAANINGNLVLLQKVLPHFVERKFGRIVFVSSQTVSHPMMGYSIYAAAKSAMEALIRNIAIEYGLYNITANTVRLGIVETARNAKFREQPKILERMTRSISLHRLGTPDEVAQSLDPLLADNCYIQGATIEVGGGLYIPSEASET